MEGDIVDGEDLLRRRIRGISSDGGRSGHRVGGDVHSVALERVVLRRAARE